VTFCSDGFGCRLVDTPRINNLRANSVDVDEQ
jgi:hypothetical protein